MFTCLNPESLARFRALYYALAPDTPHSVLLDSCGWEGKTGGFYLMGFEAEKVLQLKGRTVWCNGQRVKDIENLQALWAILAEESLVNPAHPKKAKLPFTSGWIGLLGYELNSLLETTIPIRDCENPMGELYWVQFRHLIAWHPLSQTCEIVSPDPVWRERVRAMASEVSSPFTLPGRGPSPCWEASMTPEQFEHQVEALKQQIAEGNLYQANLSLRFSSPQALMLNPFDVYDQLVRRNPSPFSGMMVTPEGTIICNSPERLVKYDAISNILESRPIAGTRGRGRTPEEEARIDYVLKTDEKEQAEHMMLVDLERNDLGRVCQPGSVHVPELAVLERYSHVTHIVSQVEGQKADAFSSWDVLNAVFPGGTITGCPKVRCMEFLAQAEPVPRGFYTGSFGYLDTSGNMDFNILIRSLFSWPDGRLDYHAGAGIVYDSVPTWEYRECLRKAEVIQGVLSHDHLIHLA